METAQEGLIPSPLSRQVVCYGSICVDQLVLLEEHPEPNAKVLTRGNKFLGGGNAGNVATCLARLSSSPPVGSVPVQAILVSKVGTDTYGNMLQEELRRDGVCIEHLIVKEGVTTPTTVVLVTEKEQARTCLHTAISEFMKEEELDVDRLLLHNGTQLFLDSRHPQAGIFLGTAALKRGIGVVVDMEKVREGTETMLCLASHLNTSSHFPAQYTGQASLFLAAKAILDRHRNITCLTVTLGMSGSIMLRPFESTDGLPMVSSLEDVVLTHPTTIIQPRSFTCGGIRTTYCPAFDGGVPVVDTTGCGDAFLGALLFAGQQVPRPNDEEALRFASVVASFKTQCVGAKTGLPRLPEANAVCVRWANAASIE